MSENLSSSPAIKELNYKSFTVIRDMLYKNFGIELKDGKRSLVQSRLNKLLRIKNFNTFENYIFYLKNDTSGRSLVELSTYLTTNHTHFNREPAHFDMFEKKVLPEHIELQEKKKNLDLRIWCAGCSSGEESYMLAMLTQEVLGSRFSSWEASLLATDLSEKVLDISKKGIYTEERVSDIPKKLLKKYFEQLPDGNFKAVDSLRRYIIYRRFNFMHEFPFKKQFNIIFCRNVMIYFDEETKANLVRKFHKSLVIGGYLFVGHSETFRNIKELTFVAPGVYKKGPNDYCQQSY